MNRETPQNNCLKLPCTSLYELVSRSGFRCYLQVISTLNEAYRSNSCFYFVAFQLNSRGLFGFISYYLCCGSSGGNPKFYAQDIEQRDAVQSSRCKKSSEVSIYIPSQMVNLTNARPGNASLRIFLGDYHNTSPPKVRIKMIIYCFH